MFDELKCILIEKPYNAHPGTFPHSIWCSLDKMYKEGWWITEIFGSIAVIVKKTPDGNFKNKYPHFRLLCKPINLSKATPAAMRTIKRIRTQQWNMYKEYMLTGIWNYNRMKKKWKKYKAINQNTIGDTRIKSLKNSPKNAKTPNLENVTTK